MLYENQTVSQFLKQEKNKDRVNIYKPHVTQQFANAEFANDASRIRLTNWFVKELMTQNVSKDTFHHTVSNWWENIKEWFLANQTNGEIIHDSSLFG